MTTLPRTILFDLDDTLLRFGAGGEGLWREVATPFAPRLGVAVEVLVAALDASRSAFWGQPANDARGRLDMINARREIVADALVALGVSATTLGHELADTLTWEREARVAPFPGAVETLQALRSRGHSLGLLTNGSREFQRGKIERFDLAPLFDIILIEGEIGFGKPDARVFERALKATGSAPREAWMVGDNLRADIAGARALGIGGVWVDSQGHGLPADPPTQPDRIVRAVAELLRE